MDDPSQPPYVRLQDRSCDIYEFVFDYEIEVVFDYEVETEVVIDC